MQQVWNQPKDLLQVAEEVQDIQWRFDESDGSLTEAAPVSAGNTQHGHRAPQTGEGPDRVRTATPSRLYGAEVQHQPIRTDNLENPQEGACRRQLGRVVVVVVVGGIRLSIPRPTRPLEADGVRR